MNKNYLEHIKLYNIRHALPTSEKAALLVIDMQNYFREICRPIVANVIMLISTFRRNGAKIFFTRHGHRDPKNDGGMLKKWWHELIIYGSPEWELVKEIEVNPKEVLLDKNRYSAFYKTDLNNLLKASGVKDLIISGVLTNCCCETTARDAYVLDYRVFFVADATAAANEDLHISSLKNLAYGFAYVMNTKEICRAFTPKSPSDGPKDDITD